MNELLISDEVITVDKIMADRLGLNGAVVYSCIMKEQTTNVNHLFNLMPFSFQVNNQKVDKRFKSRGLPSRKVM